MRIVPDSTITLYQNVDIDNGEQLVFKNRNSQIAYFTAHRHPQGAYTPCTVVRKTGRLRVEKPGSVVSACNYLSFINPSFDNKTIYARIIDYDYVNNECVEIAYMIDYWQTWMFDVTFQNSYIEREHLSQQEHSYALNNPYDPRIFEFRTGENLPISKDLEKLTYEIGDSSSGYDGYLVTAALEYFADVSDTLGVLIKISNIDFEDLDLATAANSEAFANYLASIVPLDSQSHQPDGGGLGFYWLTDKMGSYLNTHYPDRVVNNYACGTGWKYDGNPVSPFLSSKYHPGCCWIYDPNGADFLNNCGEMGDFFNILTSYKGQGMEEVIIDLSIVPNNLMFLAARQFSGTPIEAAQLTGKELEVDCKKLARFPFSYMRVMAPNGDVKEYKYENFKEVQEGQNYCKIDLLMDITDRPTLIAAPNKYKMTMDAIGSGNVNILEALMFDQFPTMPYTIDAFTAQVAAVANYTIGNRTVDNAADMAVAEQNTGKFSQFVESLKGYVGIAATTLGLDNTKKPGGDITIDNYGAAGVNIASAGAQAMGMYNTGVQQTMNRTKFEAQSERWMTADSALSEGSGSAIAAQLNLTRPAYACDKYIPSNGIGTVNFSQMSFCDLVLLRVQLSDEILALYDDWFKHYGYSSGRCGIPRVINYSRGETDNALVPEWHVLNGKPTTYVKTMDMKVTHSMLPVASFIKNMFDSGIRMIKGDSE